MMPTHPWKWEIGLYPWTSRCRLPPFRWAAGYSWPSNDMGWEAVAHRQDTHLAVQFYPGRSSEIQLMRTRMPSIPYTDDAMR